MTHAYTWRLPRRLPVRDMILHDAIVAEAAVHVADGGGTGIDNAGQFEQRQHAWLAVFIDQSIMPACMAAARGHVDGLIAALPRPLQEESASARNETWLIRSAIVRARSDMRSRRLRRQCAKA